MKKIISIICLIVAITSPGFSAKIAGLYPNGDHICIAFDSRIHSNYSNGVASHPYFNWEKYCYLDMKDPNFQYFYGLVAMAFKDNLNVYVDLFDETKGDATYGNNGVHYRGPFLKAMKIIR